MTFHLKNTNLHCLFSLADLGEEVKVASFSSTTRLLKVKPMFSSRRSHGFHLAMTVEKRRRKT